MDTLVWDLEIANEVKNVPGGWSNHEGMGLGSAVAYSYNLDRYFFFLHDSSKEKLLNLLNGNRVVSYNGINFDSKVVLGNNRKVEISNPNFSFMVENGKYQWIENDVFLHCLKYKHQIELKDTLDKRSPGGLKLSEVAISTLGPKFDKTSSGALAPVLYQEKKYDELLEYNLQDVILTRLVFEFANKYKYLLDKNSNKMEIFV